MKRNRRNIIAMVLVCFLCIGGITDANQELKKKMDDAQDKVDEEAVYRQMKHIGIEKGMTTQEILADALNGFFQRNDKPTIA